MDLRPFIPLAPAPLRPILQSLAAWMARSDARLEALERAAGITPPPKA